MGPAVPSPQAQPPSRPRRLRPFGLSTRAAVLSALGLLVLLGGVALLLANRQSRSRDELIQRFEQRGELATRFTDSVLNKGADPAVQISYAQKFLAGPNAGDAAVARYVAPPVKGQRYALLLDADGRLLGRNPAGVSVPRDLATRPAVAHALAGKPWTGGVIPTLDGPSLDFALPFPTPDGRRVIEYAGSLETMKPFFTGYLGDVPDVQGAQAYLVDSKGLVVASASGTGLGDPVPDPALRSAIATEEHGAFDHGEGRFVSEAIRKTDLRFILSAPTDVLLGPADSTNEWILFAALAGALLLLAFMVLRHQHRGRQLEVARAVLTDPLTGLPSRASFTKQVGRALEAPPHDDETVAIAAVDVDRFSRLNEAFGEGGGDAALRILADRLGEVACEGIVVGRLGGDEFGILVAQLQGGERGAGALADAVLAMVREPAEIRGEELFLPVTVGIALRSSTRDRAEILIENATHAVAQARARGARWGLHRHPAEARSLDHVRLERDLHTAVDGDELRLDYQPVISLDSGQVVAVEALIRWQHPTRGLLQPHDFIGVAEQTGLMVPVGRWALDDACRQLATWRRAGLRLALHVNVSARQLDDPDLAVTVRGALAEHDVPGECLYLELTETAILLNPDSAFGLMSELGANGVRFALDDFGTGYSSMAHLTQQSPLNMIKIDRTFIAALDEPREAAVVETIVDLTRKLRLEVVAEGVETADQVETMRSFGCRLVQGFYFWRPQRPSQIPVIVAGESPVAGARPLSAEESRPALEAGEDA